MDYDAQPKFARELSEDEFLTGEIYGEFPGVIVRGERMSGSQLYDYKFQSVSADDVTAHHK